MYKNVNSKTPLVSVVMPVYNGIPYLPEAIRSILSQSFSDFEFIIINDGSTDDSEKVISEFNDKRIIYIKNEINLGLIESLNKGIRIAKGKYIARMDADDVAYSNRLELQVQKFSLNPNAMVVGSDYLLMKRNSTKHIKNKDDSDYNKAVLFFSTCFCHPTVMMRNIFGEKNVFYDKKYIHAEDYKLWVDIYAYGDFLNVNHALLKYRSHESQISTKNKETQLKVSREIRKNYCEKTNFNLTDEQFETLNFIGNNIFITSEAELSKIEDCLLTLKNLNAKNKTFKELSFNIFLHKFWSDSCGNTNLGLNAYGIYKASVLSKIAPVSFGQKSKLMAKCLLRKFRSS